MSIGVGFYKDLDYEFDLCGNLVNPTQSSTQTGFLSNDNKDLANVFVLYSSLEPGYTGATGRDCGLIGMDGNDIGPKFVKKGTITKNFVFDPLSVSGCWLWLDASDSATITQTSSQVGTWTDKSTNGFTFNQSVAAQKPTVATNSLNGLSTLAFSRSSSQYLISPYNQAKNFQVWTRSFAMFVVFKLDDAARSAGQASLTNLDTIFSKAIYGGNPGIIDLYRAENGIFFNMYIRSGLDLGNSTTDTNYQLLSLVVNRYGTGSTGSASMTLFRNGTQISTQSFDPETANLTNSYDMIVGAYNSTSGSGVVSSTSGSIPVNSYLNGNIAEILGYSYSLDMSSETRQKIEGYLAWKWGLQGSLPSTHLYYNAPVYTYTSTTNDTENTDIITNLISGVTPWGIYDAALWNPYTKILPEATGNTARNATGTGVINFTNASGNGATAAIPCIYGGTTSSLTWADTFPTNFTICAITRYTNPTTNQGRILTTTTNVCIGHHVGVLNGVGTVGRVFWYTGSLTHYRTVNTDITPRTNWLTICAKNTPSSSAGTAANVVIANGTAVGASSDNNAYIFGGTGGGTLNINSGGEKSDWALSYLIIYASVLTDAQMQLVSEKLRYYLTFGTMRTNWNTETIRNLVPNKIPWGIYDASYYSSATLTLPEATGNFRNATGTGTVVFVNGLGDGATKNIPYIYGSYLSTTLTWPLGSIPTNYTICAISRYAGSVRGRVLQSTSSSGNGFNFWLGHHSGTAGSIYLNGIGSSLSTLFTSTNWLVACAKTDTTVTANSVLMNGLAGGTGSSNGYAAGGGTLTINASNLNEDSDWALTYLIIYDSVLSDEEMKNVSTKLQNYLTYGTMLPPAIYSTSTTALNTTTINNLFTDVKPWAIYDATYYNYVTKTLVEARGSGRNAVGSGAGVINFKVENGNGTTASVPSIYGYTNSILTWPEDSIPGATGFTICAITRYTSNTDAKQQRILTSSTTNFLLGHHGQKSGVAYWTDQWRTSSTETQATKTDWLITCGKSSSNTSTNANTILVNGSAIGTTSGATIGGTSSQRKLSINGYNGGTEQSDWALSYLIIYNSVLSDAQMTNVSAKLRNYTNYGAMLPTDNTNIIKNLISGKTPWGIYDAAYYDFSTGYLPEAINGDILKRAIAGGAITYSIDSGNGAINKVPYISGGVNSSLTWPADTVPINFTICGIVRYTSSDATKQQRIFTSTANEFLLGHKAGTLGIAYWSSAERTATTGLSTQPTKTNWLVCSAKSSSDTNTNANTVLMNGSAIGTTTGAGLSFGNQTLSINGYTEEKSEWAFTYLIIYDSVLSDAEIATVSTKLLNYMTYGTMIPPSISYNAVTISANTTAIMNLIPGVTPWGIYDATYYDAYNNRLPEARGNGRDANCTGTINLKFESGNGATGIIPSIYGGTTSTLLWPVGSIPSSFTMCAITRYTTTSGNGRILTYSYSTRSYDSENFLLGHHSNGVGKAYWGASWKTSDTGLSPQPTLTNWLNSCAKTTYDRSIANTVLMNGNATGTTSGNATTSRLSINDNEPSNWAFSYLVIYNSALTDANMANLSIRLQNYLLTGSMLLTSAPTTTGNNVSISGNIYIFTGSGSSITLSNRYIQVLAVGGGGGGSTTPTGCGGGGGGGVVEKFMSITTATTISVTIGAGGLAGNETVGVTGGTTKGEFTGSYTNIIAGGGGGGGYGGAGFNGSNDGGSGGGAGRVGNNTAGGTANISNNNYANAGGQSSTSTVWAGAGGGGGAGTVGLRGTSNRTSLSESAGTGGNGFLSSITGTDLYWGGGGGGGCQETNSTSGSGGLGGGGAGGAGGGDITGNVFNSAKNGARGYSTGKDGCGGANTGGGGGGYLEYQDIWGKGGSGIFIVKIL